MVKKDLAKVQVTLPPKIHALLKAAAAGDNRTPSNLAADIIIKAMQEFESKSKLKATKARGKDETSKV